MHFRFILIASLLLWGTATMAQDTSKVTDPADNPPVFVDSVETRQGLEGLDPSKIALINIVKGAKLKEKFGPRGENGVIYVETVPFARKRYTKMFGLICPAYATALQRAGTDSSFQYILDGIVLEQSVPQLLAALERAGIGSIDVIPAWQLKKEYNVEHKELGVIIRSVVK